MADSITLTINGRPVAVEPGTSVAAALVKAGVIASRRSVTGEPRSALCGMGVCFECRVMIDGVPHRLGCQTYCEPGMEVETDDR